MADRDEWPKEVREEIEAAGPMLLSHLHLLIEAYDDGGMEALNARAAQLGSSLAKVITPAQSLGLYIGAMVILVRETAPDHG